MLSLRSYQQQAVEAVYSHLRQHKDNPCVVIPTGGGKTPVIATICKDAAIKWNGRALVVAHVKELLEQTADKLRQVCPEVKLGIYSAGLKRRDTGQSVTVAGIQSIYRRACDFDPFNLIIIDEAHMIPTEGEGMYRQFLSDAQRINPKVRTIGLTATPYRMKSGLICSPDHFLNSICYEVGVKQLILGGYLCPLVTKAGSRKIDTSELHVRGGEFVAGELEALMDTDALVNTACAEIVNLTQDRSSVLIFSTGIKHGHHVQRVLREQHKANCGFVCGETPPRERERLLLRFRNGDFKFLCNVNVLTTGFDAPNIDCIAMLRPTMSTGLYYQMVGRGFRMHPGKRDCLVLDFGGNVLRHGPVDDVTIHASDFERDHVTPTKECPTCHGIVATGVATCPECGHEFPPPERKRHSSKAATDDILSSTVIREEFDVLGIRYSVHTKHDAADDAPKTLRVDYRLGPKRRVSEWICFEHSGWARRRGHDWWRQRSYEPFPATAKRAAEIANAGGVAMAETVTIRTVLGHQYPEIVSYKLGPIPELIPASGTDDDDDDETAIDR